MYILVLRVAYCLPIAYFGFLPRKRTKHHAGKIKSFPKDDAAKAPHLTAFMTYKAGQQPHKDGTPSYPPQEGTIARAIYLPY